MNYLFWAQIYFQDIPSIFLWYKADWKSNVLEVVSVSSLLLLSCMEARSAFSRSASSFQSNPDVAFFIQNFNLINTWWSYPWWIRWVGGYRSWIVSVNDTCRNQNTMKGKQGVPNRARHCIQSSLVCIWHVEVRKVSVFIEAELNSFSYSQASR